MKPEMKKLIIANLPYLLFVYLFGKLGQTYIHSEKDILKLVNTLICNTKGEGEKSAERDRWDTRTNGHLRIISGMRKKSTGRSFPLRCCASGSRNMIPRPRTGKPKNLQGK